MKPLFKKLIYALWYDELAATRWLRGILAALTTSGMIFADQIAQFLNAPKLAMTIKGISILCAFISVAITAGEKNPKEVSDVGKAEESKPSVG